MIVPGGATEVRVNLIILELKITGDKNGEELHLDISMHCKWYDHRLANWPKKEKPIPSETWRPEFYLANPLALKDSAAKAALTFPNVDNADGEVEWKVGFEHITINMTNNNFHRLSVFPYDSTRVDFFVCFAGDLRSESIADVKPVFDPRVTWHKSAVHCMVQSGTHSGEHVLARVSYAFATHASPRQPDHVYPDVVFSLHIGRDPTFYHYKAFGPLWTVCALGFMSYASDVDQLAERMQVVLAMFLTCFAIQWVVLDRLPSVPYLTILDRITFVTILALFLMALGSCVVYRIHKRDPDLAAQVDLIVMGVIAGIYAFSHLYAALLLRKNRNKSGMTRKWVDGGSWWAKMVKVKEGFTIDYAAHRSATGMDLPMCGSSIAAADF